MTAADPTYIPSYLIADVASIGEVRAEMRVGLSVPDTAVVVLDAGCGEAEWFGEWSDVASAMAKDLRGLIVRVNSDPAEVLEDHRTTEHAEQCDCPHQIHATAPARGCLVEGGCEWECGGYEPAS